MFELSAENAAIATRNNRIIYALLMRAVIKRLKLN